MAYRQGQKVGHAFEFGAFHRNLAIVMRDKPNIKYGAGIVARMCDQPPVIISVQVMAAKREIALTIKILCLKRKELQKRFISIHFAH